VFIITVQQTDVGDVVRVYPQSSLFKACILISLLGVLCQLLPLPLPPRVQQHGSSGVQPEVLSESAWAVKPWCHARSCLWSPVFSHATCCLISSGAVAAASWLFVLLSPWEEAEPS